MSFYFIGPSSAGLSQHAGTPDISSSTVVLTTDSGVTIFPRIQLLKVHGKYIYYKLKKGYLVSHLTYNSLINLYTNNTHTLNKYIHVKYKRLLYLCNNVIMKHLYCTYYYHYSSIIKVYAFTYNFTS